MSTLDSPILEVRYEDTVLDLEGQARRLIEFCGLEWDPNCLSFHTTSRGVNRPADGRCASPSTRHRLLDGAVTTGISHRCARR